MKFIGEIDIHDLRNLPSNYKLKDLNDEDAFDLCDSETREKLNASSFEMNGRDFD